MEKKNYLDRFKEATSFEVLNDVMKEIRNTFSGEEERSAVVQDVGEALTNILKLLNDTDQAGGLEMLSAAIFAGVRERYPALSETDAYVHAAAAMSYLMEQRHQQLHAERMRDMMSKVLNSLMGGNVTKDDCQCPNCVRRRAESTKEKEKEAFRETDPNFN